MMNEKDQLKLKVHELERSCPDPLIICESNVSIHTSHPTPKISVYVPIMEHEETHCKFENELNDYNVSFSLYSMNVDAMYLNPLLITTRAKAEEFVHYWGWFSTLSNVRSTTKVSFEQLKCMEDRINQIVAISKKFVEYAELYEKVKKL